MLFAATLAVYAITFFLENLPLHEDTPYSRILRIFSYTLAPPSLESP
jgi:hypothetical protein